jgi:hypothetical protein
MPANTYIAKKIESAPDAIASHVRWKITLLMATKMREPLSARATNSIQRPEECSIRKWLLSDHTLHLRNTPEYQAALDQHLAFHGQMLRIADLINSGDYVQAERLLNSPEHFQNPSIALANAIMALDRIPTPAKPVQEEAVEPEVLQKIA